MLASTRAFIESKATAQKAYSASGCFFMLPYSSLGNDGYPCCISLNSIWTLR
jgi:hypothetical protein